MYMPEPGMGTDCARAAIVAGELSAWSWLHSIDWYIPPVTGVSPVSCCDGCSYTYGLKAPLDMCQISCGAEPIF